MKKTTVVVEDMEIRKCIQDPGFLDDPHARWAALRFVELAGHRADVAVESVEPYAGLIQKKKKAGCPVTRGQPVPFYLN
ncbi:MAG: hypothetical protein JW929_13470 [Anaerolineales bacterium]|nr:hypothetical protein [Anaerolineales bacterium]